MVVQFSVPYIKDDYLTITRKDGINESQNLPLDKLIFQKLIIDFISHDFLS